MAGPREKVYKSKHGYPAETDGNVADFKAGKDWMAAEHVAHRFLSGDDTEPVLALKDWLVELVAEVQDRYRRMRDRHVR